MEKKFDTIIIGGGLAGLTCGIRLQAKGKKCAIVSTGQSALHFFSGSFGLLSRDAEGNDVKNPLEAVKHLCEGHPYSKLGENLGKLADEAEQLLCDSGIAVEGKADTNAYALTPMGTMKPTWLTLADFKPFADAQWFNGKKVTVANIAGFLDFNMKFVTDALESSGAVCEQKLIELPEVEALRTSPTEMRATNIARILDKETTHNQLLTILKNYSIGVDAVVLPAVVGLASDKLVKVIKEAVPTAIFVPTMPPSVAGIRTQQQLRRRFEILGGTFLPGDTVVKADKEGNRIKAIYTTNHVEMQFTADTFVLASGSFFSNGLVAHSHTIIEPVFGLDVDYEAARADWFNQNFFNSQRYQTFGVATDKEFRTSINGQVVENLYAVGSILSGYNGIKEGSGAGVALLTAIHVADNLK